MFHPTRPREKWSRVRNWRATTGGDSTIVDTVVTNPSRRVAAARAEISICGSNVVNCTFRSTATGMTWSPAVG